MEMVDVVIRLPLSTYNMCKANKRVSFADVGIIGKAIIDNGIALPKGHGRLKDVDELLKYNCVDVWTDYGLQTSISVLSVDTAPTIIPADSEVE